MDYTYGHDILSMYDSSEDDHEYLASLIKSGNVPASDMNQVLRQCLVFRAENWQNLIDCARAIRNEECPNLASLEPQDTLSYIPVVLKASLPEAAWARTDRFIAEAKEQATKARAELDALHLSTFSSSSNRNALQVIVPEAGKLGQVSHYWGAQSEVLIPPALSQIPRDLKRSRSQNTKGRRQCLGGTASLGKACVIQAHNTQQGTGPAARSVIARAPQVWLRLASQVGTSPYFGPSDAQEVKTSPRRPAPGIVSSVPFPPLDSTSFGLVQERLAHDPFWLLIAVTFLIKTRGTVAIPVFEKVKLRFPSPAHIADPENAEAILDMIRPLGLAKNRLAFLHKYANGYLTAPPAAGRRYRVPGYDHRDTDSQQCAEAVATAADGLSMPDRDAEDDIDAWEIGHLTKGKYALDSWRIFCRDELLGRAEDWNGLGREGKFQPEWMRVKPNDKELRAYLRWLWMREGWEWDPRSGERTVLREKLRSAVNEERVEYDDVGELRILDEPR